nr:hypothetical protein [Nitrosomonas nitrosa]
MTPRRSDPPGIPATSLTTISTKFEYPHQNSGWRMPDTFKKIEGGVKAEALDGAGAAQVLRRLARLERGILAMWRQLAKV